MTDPFISEPIAGETAFDGEGEMEAWSQAAQMVGLGTGHRQMLRQVETEADALGLPAVAELEGAFPATYAAFYLQDHLDVRAPFSERESPGWTRPLSVSRVFGRGDGEGTQLWWRTGFGEQSTDLARRLWRNTGREGREGAAAAATLLYVGQFSEHEVVRVAAAAQLAWFGTPLAWPTVEILVEGLSSTSETVQVMAGDALFHSAPNHPALREPGQDEPEEGTAGKEPNDMSIIVPGTWTRFRRKSSWWRPGERLFAYLQREPGIGASTNSTLTPVGRNLYTDDDYFRWTGNYSAGDRNSGAMDLATWAANHLVFQLDKVIAHSHGGNVVLNAAAQHDLKIGLLVLLSTPAHERTEGAWDTISSNVGRIIAMRAHFDLVVLSDRLTAFMQGTWSTRCFPQIGYAIFKSRCGSVMESSPIQ